eukprot:s4180_g13.t1
MGGNLDQATQLLLASAAAESPEMAIPPPPPPPAEVDPLSEKVDTLVGMGFTEVQARDALDGCSGNLERAVEYLTTQAS